MSDEPADDHEREEKRSRAVCVASSSSCIERYDSEGWCLPDMVDHYGMARTPMRVYFVGPIVGGMLGVLVYDFIARARVGSAPERGSIEQSAVEGEFRSMHG